FSFVIIIFLYLFFFFFQAEDGIRDSSVTGVQTCALPISDEYGLGRGVDAAQGRTHRRLRARAGDDRGACGPSRIARPLRPEPRRSEERRVGKECRSRVGEGD